MNDNQFQEMMVVLREIRDRLPYWWAWSQPVYPPNTPPPVYPYVGPTCGSGGSQTINCKGGEKLG